MSISLTTQRERARDAANQAEIERLLADERMAAYADYFRSRLRWCKRRGRAKILQEMRKMLASRHPKWLPGYKF